jgi:glucose-6-phosphate 1-dehydrogenase
VSQTLPTTTLVIFGVTGDLSHRYLLPALSKICTDDDIRTKLDIIGASLRAWKISLACCKWIMRTKRTIKSLKLNLMN